MNNLLKIENLSKHYIGIDAVKNASFALSKGEIVALIGGNGAGKSTLFNLIAGLEQQDSGYIYFEGMDISHHSFQMRAKAGLALCFQRPRLFRNESCLDNLIVSRHGHPGERLISHLFSKSLSDAFEVETRQKALESLEFIGLADKAYQKAGVLSGGQQKLLYIAMLLINDPKVLLLDEPFSNVSATMIEQISQKLRTLAENGKTLFIIEHHIAQVTALSHRIIYMEKGSLFTSSINPSTIII